MFEKPFLTMLALGLGQQSGIPFLTITECESGELLVTTLW